MSNSTQEQYQKYIDQGKGKVEAKKLAKSTPKAKMPKAKLNNPKI